MTKFNRFISLLLVVVMLFGAMPITSGAVVTDTYGGTTFERLCDLTINLNGGTLNDTTGALANVTNRKSPFNVKVYSAFASGYVGVPHTYNLLVGVPNDFCNTMTQFHTLLNNILSCTTRDGYKAVGFNFQGITTLYSPYSGAEVFAGELLQSDGSKYTMTIVWECTGEPHAYERTAYTAPTCTTDGSETYTCSKDNCGYSYTSTIAALGHSYTETKKATCTSSGTKVCSVCDATTTISALGHDFGSWVYSGLGFDIYRCKRTEPSQCYSYTQKRFTVTYDANGGTPGTVTAQTVEYPATNNSDTTFTTDSVAEPTLDGYKFMGWAETENATSGGTSFTAGKNITLYAVWKKAYTLTLNAGEGGVFEDGSTEKSYTILSGETYTTAIGNLPIPLRTGYTFGGFKYNESFTLNTGNMGNAYTLTDDAEVTAQWTANTYTVVYKANGGSGSMSSVVHTYDEAKNLTANAFTRSNYTFKGWNTKADGTGTSYDDKASVKNLTTANNGTVTLYAQWRSNTATTYSVVFSAGNDNATGTMATKNYKRDTNYKLPANNFEYEGHTFVNWLGSDGNYYSSGQTVKNLAEVGDTFVLTAQWAPELFTITLDPNGGSISTGHNTTYTNVAYGTSYSTLFGTYPEATRKGHSFDGWEHVESSFILTDDNMGNTITQSGTFVAKWTKVSNTITFHATGAGCAFVEYDYLEIIYDTKGENDTGIDIDLDFTAPGGNIDGESTYSIDISVNDYFNTFGDFPTAICGNYIVDYWFGSYILNGQVHSAKITRNSWATEAFDKGVDLELYAVYRCDHQRHGYTWAYKDGAGYVYDEAYHDSALDTSNPNLSRYFRHEGTCNECDAVTAFGYNVHFLADNNGAYKEYLRGDILLSSAVPLEDLYTIKNGGYNTEKGFVIDYLEDELNPEVTIHFNPILKAAKPEAASHFKCWEVDYAFWGHRGNDLKNFELAPTNETGVYTWIFDSTDISLDAGLHSSHLRLAAKYDSGYHELLFNAAVGLDGNIKDSACLVDSGYRYGVVPIQYGQAYKDVMYYSPTAKHVASYAGNNSFDGYTGKVEYSRAQSTLYCNVSWKYVYTGGAFHLTSKNFIAGETYGIRGDGMYTANYVTIKTSESDGISQGSLATVYANNKGVDSKYNKAYFDVNENSGGTMYYMYYTVKVTEKKEDGSSVTYNKWQCEPLFAYNPITDYPDALKCYPSEDPDSSNRLYGDDNTKYFQIEDDFNYTNYTSYNKVIIAKEPKRYTYYLGDEAYYVFPTPCNTPDGQPYQAYSGEPNGATGLDGGVTKDPQIMDKYVTSDANGYSYFLDVKDNNNNNSNFRLVRCSEGYPTFSQYTTHTELDSYLYGTDVDSLPLGYCAMHEKCNVHNETTGTINRPYSGPEGAEHKYSPAIGYEDYGTHYGAGLRLTYPDGDDVTIFDCSVNDKNSAGEAVTVTVDMQAAYYAGWEFVVGFNSNFPSGKTATTKGFPTSVIGKQTSNGTVVSSNDITSVGNNYTVYQYTGFWGFTVMPGYTMFTCEGYYIDSWDLYDVNGNKTSYSLKAYTGTEFDNLTSEQKLEYAMNAYNAYLYASEPGAEFRAVWKRMVKFTVAEGGSGYDPFVTVTYKDFYSEKNKDLDANNTDYIYTRADTVITLSQIAPADGWQYAYITLNNNKFNLVPDRIITNKSTYSFYIVDDTTMTVQFVESGATDKLYLDRNNKLLSTASDPWRLYKDLPTRTPAGVINAPSTNVSYYSYKDNTTYDITVNGATKDQSANGVAYDEIVTLSTAPVSGDNVFVGWQIGGNYVCYDTVYNHRVTANVTITAVYSLPADAESQQPTIDIIHHTSSTGSNTRQFISEYWLPNNHRLIETGYIITKKNDGEITFEDLYNDDNSLNEDYSKIVSTNASNEGNFKLILPYTDIGYSVVAYIYYIDENGIVKVKYSYN